MELNEIDQVIRTFYPENGSILCSEKTGKNRSYIMNRAFRIGVKTNPGVRIRLCNIKEKRLYLRNYNIDVDKFYSMSPEASYFLGFLWGDGSICISGYHYMVGLSIVSEDFLDIENIVNYFGVWSKYIRRRKARKEQTTINTNNKRLYNFLYDNDYHRKSVAAPNKILDLVPKEFQYLWWRGYSDADGCFYTSGKYTKQFVFSGNYDTDWSKVLEILFVLGCDYHYNKRILQPKPNVCHKNSSIRVVNKKSLIKWVDYIYPNFEYDNIGLKRKFQKAQSIKLSIDKI